MARLTCVSPSSPILTFPGSAFAPFALETFGDCMKYVCMDYKDQKRAGQQSLVNIPVALF